MYTIVNLYSTKQGEISKFLTHYYNKEILINPDLKWEKKYENSIEIADIIGAFIDNNDNYAINMWISIDEGTFIHVSEQNADAIIRYLYERFPY